jgi:hypothetical protein
MIVHCCDNKAESLSFFFSPLQSTTPSYTHHRVTKASLGTFKCSLPLLKTPSQPLASSLHLADAPKLCANAASFVSVSQVDSLAYH